MDREPSIRVGLITAGTPLAEAVGSNLTRLANLLIGEGFHWQKEIDILLEGKIQLLDKPQGNIHAINIVGLENYIKSVIGSEMSPTAPTEFLKAHAVISRTWALRKLWGNNTDNNEVNKHSEVQPADSFISWEESDSHYGFDVCSDDHCQRYQGVTPCNEDMKRIVDATRGLIVTDFDGNPVDTRFSKCCGGLTEVFASCWADTDKPCLESITDPYCDLSDMQPAERESFLKSALKDYDRDDDYMHWQADIDRDELRCRVKDRYAIDLGKIRSIEPAEIGKSGRITTLRITGENRSIEVGKTLAIRRLLAANCLRSSRFKIAETPSGFHLEGRGWGHGVGLCQIGAARMAHDGADFREILRFYYPGSQITKAYD